MATFDRIIIAGRSNIHEVIFKLANPKGNTSITVNRFKEVARLSEGNSFGELALLRGNEGRAATIQCLLPTRLACLHKKDYKWTIGIEEKKRMKEIVSYLRSFRIF